MSQLNENEMVTTISHTSQVRPIVNDFYLINQETTHSSPLSEESRSEKVLDDKVDKKKRSKQKRVHKACVSKRV